MLAGKEMGGKRDLDEELRNSAGDATGGTLELGQGSTFSLTVPGSSIDDTVDLKRAQYSLFIPASWPAGWWLFIARKSERISSKWGMSLST